MAVILKLDGVSKSFARVETTDITTALTDVNLEMKSGEFVSLVGTSGCGKSTMLRLIAGLIQPTTGTLTVNGEEIKGTDTSRGMMFQQHTLFPWLTVEKNIAFCDKMKGEHKTEASKAEVDRLLSREPTVLAGFFSDFIYCSPGMLCQEIVHFLAHGQKLFRNCTYVSSITSDRTTKEWLMDHEPGVWE